MRVLTVIGNLSVGGAEIYISRVARAIHPYGVQLEICTLERSGALLQELEQAGVTVHGTRFTFRRRHAHPLRLMPTLFRTVADIRALVRSGRYDIVHTYLYVADLLGTVGARLAGCPRIIVSRRALHAWRHGRNPLEHAFELGTNVLAHELIANSRAVLEDAERFEQVLPRYRTVVYNGVEVSSYPQARLGSRGRLELITVGALSPRKGQEYALRALRSVLDAGVESRLTLVGAGSDEALLRGLAIEMSVAEHVVFAGERSDPRPYLAASHIFVLPSRQEGFSNALLEAMASGLPAVATDVGGNAEALQEGGGAIVPPADSLAIANAIISLAADRAGLRDRGRYNRERAGAVFSIEASVRSLAEWYLNGPRVGI
jgi:glycosyltransferase involved in cell wall biosynthesis